MGRGRTGWRLVNPVEKAADGGAKAHDEKTLVVATHNLYEAIKARTRQGLPEPRTILSGGVIRIAPLGGN